jgi:hypothetical protein
MTKTHEPSSTTTPIRDRWSARPGGADTRRDVDVDVDGAARAGALFQRAAVKQALGPSALSAIGERLHERRPVATRPLLVRLAVVLLLVLAGGGVVVSATLLRRLSASNSAVTPPAVPAPSAPQAGRSLRIAPVTAPAEIPEPTAPEIERPHHQIPRRDLTPPASPPALMPPPATAPPGPSAMAEEAALLGAALRALREENDAAGALALLDQHDARFAAGVLADEAGTTRIEALLRLGRHAQALALLDARAPEPTGHGRESLVARGELRADAGRHREALADFDALLGHGPAGDAIAERALYGRAACLARAGDASSARASLEDYLSRFPAGRFASRVRATLDR